MGDILKAIYEDEKDYAGLCRLYNEKPEGKAYCPQYYRLQKKWREDGCPVLPDVEVDVMTLKHSE